MNFNGAIIKTKAKEACFTLLRIAQQLDVSRQTVNSWIDGQVPRGGHLVKLCTLLNIKPADFFAEPSEGLFSVPLHRTFKGKIVSSAMREASQQLAEQYLNLFRQVSTASILPVVRMTGRSKENAEVIAHFLRKQSGVQEGKPMDYEAAFRLLANLGIYAIFRTFSEDLAKGSYAFYSRIAGQRVVFVNIDSNVLDLIFQLLHETVHAIRDEEPSTIYSQEEEFCDTVAKLAQFPDFYVKMVARYIASCTNTGTIINRLKEVSRENDHSLWGIYFRLKHMGVLTQELNVGGAATNLNKAFPCLRDILFSKADLRNYVDMLYELSPNFMNLVTTQMPHCSIRKFGEWLGLDTSIDASTVKEEITRRKGHE